MKKTGTSIALMSGLMLFGGMIVNPIFFDGFMFDPVAIYLLWAGIQFRKGELTNVKWPAIWSGWYCLMAFAATIIAVTSPDNLNVGKYPVSSSDWLRYSTLAELVIFLIWNMIHLTALLKYKQNQGMEPTSANAQSIVPEG